MIKKLALLILLNSLFNSIYAQQGGITGKTIDSTNVKSVVFASVSAIRKSDSLLIKHSRSNQQGQFTLAPLTPGNYILLIAHGSFVDYVDDFTINENDALKDLGSINMIQRGNLLKEVIIKNAAGIKIKGDTLEYLADSFKVKQGAMVEDLLKALPGIQVNKKGEITAMGEKVEKVLVDGEEFFGDDPTIATQNIQSKVVEKVQVFDKKSDQASFTGFDDGQEQKTINLKLKKDMNHGEFGKIEAGWDGQERWNNQAMINSFKDKQQISAYGLMSSIGKTGLGWEDRNTYTGAGDNMQMNEDGMFMWNVSDDQEEGGGWGNSVPEGITKAWVGGLHFADKWDDAKQHVNLNYSFGRINRTKSQTSNTENLFPGNKYQSAESSNSFNSRNTHRISGKYDFAIDSTLTILYNLSGRLSFIESNSTRSTINSRYDDSPINQSQNINNSNSTNTRVSNQVTLNKKLKKTGRTLSLSAGYTYTNNNSLGKLNGVSVFSLGGNPSTNITDQQKEQQQLNNSVNADLTYTEPLNKKLLLKLSYGIGNDASKSNKNTMESVTPNDDYSKRIDSLSSDFDSKVFSQTVGAELKYNEKKYNITLGTKVRYSKFKQADLVRNLNYDYNRTNLFPTLRFNYKFDQFRRLTFSYSGSTRQPQLTQIQPVQDNSNPLEIYVGNPNLKIGYDQVFNINYFNYKVLSGRSIYTGIYLTNNYNN
ncbi:MAG: TonB-dependent receptor, partial [Chitinophagaceae bacterium]|nr:TonB-dependent receptor [Chitinophagaceae bacterium]